MNKKVYQAVLSGKSDSNIDFKDFKNLIEALGFVKRRISGSHMIYVYNKKARINIQKYGNKAKRYQVKQLREIILEYDL